MGQTSGEIELRGLPVRVTERGTGTPILYLHGEWGLDLSAEFIDLLAETHRVIMPVHPGYEGTSRPRWCNSIADLVYLYMDLLEEFDLSDVTLIGSSIGGWIATEMSVRSQERLGSLVLVDPVGIKVGDKWTRDIVDVFATHPAKVAELMWHHTAAAPDAATATDDELRSYFGNQAATALYVWEPYMHNPKLRHLLGRIHRPTLVVWGANDGIVSTEYGKAYTEAIPGASMTIIDEAGHFPHIEQPREFVRTVHEFLAGSGTDGARPTLAFTEA